MPDADPPVPDPDPLLPDTTEDERDPGDSGSDAWRDGDPEDLERFLRDRPPHHG